MDIQPCEVYTRKTERPSTVKGVSNLREHLKISNFEEEDNIRGEARLKRRVESNKAMAQVCVIKKGVVHVTDFV